MDYGRLGLQLRRAREYARMTQLEAATQLGITGAALSQYESGKRRIDALTLERLSRLYGVPLAFFFHGKTIRHDWEESLRAKTPTLSIQGKAGIGRLIERVRDLEYLYRITGTLSPSTFHSPFEPLHHEGFSEHDVVDWAEKARRYFDVGHAPLPDVRSFLERQGYHVFMVPLGQQPDDLSGLFFIHPQLGPIVAVNEDHHIARRPFTLAHELAHGLFHYDRPAILCRSSDQDPLERFADRFASHFLVPTEALHEWLRDRRIQKVERPEEVVHLARYFGVSYLMMLRRLREVRGLGVPEERLRSVKPVALAKSLGYPVAPYEFGDQPLPLEERVPRIYLDLAYRGALEGQISVSRAAELLGVSDIELEERLEQLAEAQAAPATEALEIYA
ncbi:XRE family transcriptional regulator [Thermomicrobiaceae bacterium CFH 74404]|uniref:XRE family transcriptional regulator n=1 Tax=Thermalbibacter longus TaxID=2951981 RepID=A0AA41WE34_9BACT|nr:XRE family transcriptional regulator [Thermalbibacter longus]MCM8748675.1 XRE family transcriptional regulator [Thermalbibacter longus]